MKLRPSLIFPVLPIFVYLYSACTGVMPPLTPRGTKVFFFAEVSEDDYDFVKKIRCYEGRNFMTLESNKKRCYIRLRNKAGALGGDAVVVVRTDREEKCNNCIYYYALVYKVKAHRRLDRQFSSPPPPNEAK